MLAIRSAQTNVSQRVADSRKRLNAISSAQPNAACQLVLERSAS
ncbi:hypothetical protein KCA1_2737 [Lactiplantibacillus pentosus KCA1]|nr:hypothetical protein KCA1_2737 [Lactiplantibacillus pentosus KCA1]